MEINYKEIGKGVYKMMPEDDKKLVTFGMINIKWKNLIEKELRKKLVDMCKTQMGFNENESGKSLEKFVKQELLDEIIGKICVEIYAEADRQGNMIV